jgi:hypothetical protein
MKDEGHKSKPMNFQLLIDSIPALIRTAPPNGYLDFFSQISLGYVGVSLGDLQGWKGIVAIRAEEVAGSRSF